MRLFIDILFWASFNCIIDHELLNYEVWVWIFDGHYNKAHFNMPLKEIIEKALERMQKTLDDGNWQVC